jgi:ribonuclease HI
VYECKQKCWQLKRSVGREVSFMCIPAHVGTAGNERADFEARQATLGNMVYNVQSVARNLLQSFLFFSNKVILSNQKE